MKNLGHLALFFIGNFNYFALLAFVFFGVMLSVAFRRQITAEAHRDRTGGNFGEPGRDDDARRSGNSSQPGGQRKRHRQTVRHSDHDVAHGFTRGEMSLSVTSLWHSRLLRSVPGAVATGYDSNDPDS